MYYLTHRVEGRFEASVFRPVRAEGALAIPAGDAPFTFATCSTPALCECPQQTRSHSPVQAIA